MAQTFTTNVFGQKVTVVRPRGRYYSTEGLTNEMLRNLSKTFQSLGQAPLTFSEGQMIAKFPKK